MSNFDLLTSILENADHSPCAYSGRAMYGSKCVGVECEDEASLLMKVVMGAIEEFDGDDDAIDKLRTFIEEIGKPRTDSMGRSLFVYWPEVEWDKDAL